MSENRLPSHIIYHVPGRKVGCTKDLDYRIKEAGYVEVEVLHRLYDSTNKKAGDLEWKEADARGYTRGTHYAEAIRKRDLARAAGSSKGGEAGIASQMANGTHCSHTGRCAFQRSDIQRELASRGASKGGVASMKSQISNGKHSSQTGRGAFFQSDIQSELGQRSAASAKHISKNPEFQKRNSERLRERSQQTLTCPHCGHVGCGRAPMKRWHFDRCKQRDAA